RDGGDVRCKIINFDEATRFIGDAQPPAARFYTIREHLAYHRLNYVSDTFAYGLWVWWLCVADLRFAYDDILNPSVFSEHITRSVLDTTIETVVRRTTRGNVRDRASMDEILEMLKEN